jgi:hypothetical protein
VAVVAAASAGVAVDCAEAAVELFAPPEVAPIAAADSAVALDEHLPCRDLPDFHRHLRVPAAAALPVGRRICARPMAICQHPAFDRAVDSAAGRAAWESPIGPAAFDQAQAFDHRPAFVQVAAHCRAAA